MEKNEDRSLVRLLREIRGSSSKKLILTTREYILSQARQQYELLASNDIDLARCVVDLDEYSRHDRARILYNHLYFFSVPESHIHSLLSEKSYLKIIDHQNFSPRIIEWMTSVAALREKPGDFAREFLANLDNPDRVWSHAFQHDLSPDARQLLLILGSMPDLSSLSCVQTTFRTADDHRLGEKNRRFENALKEIEGTFVRTSRSRDELFLEFHNPSITDFVRRRFASNPDLPSQILADARYFEQVEFVVRLGPGGKLLRSASEYRGPVDSLLAAVDRTIRSPSATVVRFGNGSRSWLSTTSESVGERTARLSSWATDLDSPALRGLAMDICQEECCEESLGKHSATSLAGFLEAAHLATMESEHDISGLVDFIALAAMAELDSGPGTDDWTAWGQSVTLARSRFTSEQLESFRELAGIFCENEGEVILENAENGDEASSWAEDLAGVASDWGIAFDTQFDSLQDKIAENFPEDQRWDDDDGYHGRSTTEPAAVGGSIEDLFNSLRR